MRSFGYLTWHIDKDKFISRDRLRWARLYDIPTQKDMPPGFPKNTISVQRALTAIMLSAPERLAATLSVLYHASFAGNLDVVDKDVLHKLLSEVHGEDGAREIMTKVTGHHDH
jgi:2-hydroxychromene-2-carboxylate isomerase